MSKKRILFVTQEMSPYLEQSSIAKIVRYLAPYIQKNEYEIRVLMPRFGTINEKRHRLHEVVAGRVTLIASVHVVDLTVRTVCSAWAFKIVQRLQHGFSPVVAGSHVHLRGRELDISKRRDRLAVLRLA